MEMFVTPKRVLSLSEKENVPDSTWTLAFPLAKAPEVMMASVKAVELAKAPE